MKKKKTDLTVVKSNALIESRYKYTLPEVKLILWMLTEIKPEDQDFQIYRIYIKDFIKSIGTKAGSEYQRAKEAAKLLKEKVLEIPTETGDLIISWLSSVEFYKGKGYIDFSFDPKLKPYLVQLKKNFTVYDIRNVLPCNSVYSIRIYQLLKAFEGLEQREISLEDLRRILMLEEEYQRFFDFKRRVLEPARKELKKLSDIYFTYRPVKKGRKITAIKFVIKKQKQRRFDFDTPMQPHVSEAIPIEEGEKISLKEHLKRKAGS